VLPNSDIEIEEVQEITFTSGSFTFGYRAIPLNRVEDIGSIRVFERQGDRLLEYTYSSSEANYTFTTYQEDNNQVIYWYFPETKYSSHTYIIRYLVKGGLRIYEGGDQVWWKAIGGDHNFPIRSSRVTVQTPATFSPGQFVIQSYGAAADNYIADGSTVIFEANDIDQGDELEVRVQFPHGVVQGEPPAWQAEDDRRRELQERYGPILSVGFLFLGLLVIFGGPLGIYVLWYMRGKDEPAGLVTDYISEPPGDLSPGAVGTLVDEQADMQDILATLVDLARRGALHIEEENKTGFLGIGSGRDFIFHLKDEHIATKPYEKRLIKKIFKSRETRRLSDLREEFYTVLPELRRLLYTDVLQVGFFPASPEKTRQLYMGLGVVGLFLSIMVGVGLLVFTAEYTGLAICLPVAMIITAVIFIVVGRHMPKKTPQGAEEAAKWLAFKRYLENIEKYGNLEEAKEQFDKYLPYAIAFGIERGLIRQFSKIDTPAPTWYGPVVMGGPHHYPYGETTTPAGGGHVPGPLAGAGGPPTLSDMSRGIGTSLQSMSAGLSSMLSSASRTFTSRPSSSSSSSGGSFSGGGFSGGGGGGGSAGFG
jgi:uncharacterized membrane protein YgcG